MNCLFSDEQITWLKVHVKGTRFTALTNMFNEHFGTNFLESQILHGCMRRGLHNELDCKIPVGGLTGVQYRFRKGHRPHNKGVKGICARGSEKGWFGKGHRPHNWQPVGSERISKDGYLEIKILEPNKWRGKHRVEWEKAYGPIPKGHAVVFADGNNRNFDLSNLILVSRKQLVYLNKNQMPLVSRDFTLTALAIADVAHTASALRSRALEARA